MKLGSSAGHVSTTRSLELGCKAVAEHHPAGLPKRDAGVTVRSLEDLLGIAHLNIRDDNAGAMADVFTRQPDFTPYTAIIPGSLCAPPVDPALVPDCQQPSSRKTAPVPDLHDRAWWAANTAGFEFSREDKIDADAFNQILVEGARGPARWPRRSTLRSRSRLALAAAASPARAQLPTAAEDTTALRRGLAAEPVRFSPGIIAADTGPAVGTAF
jgi:hypothetical protein